jgi:hypothetical protein
MVRACEIAGELRRFVEPLSLVRGVTNIWGCWDNRARSA